MSLETSSQFTLRFLTFEPLYAGGKTCAELTSTVAGVPRGLKVAWVCTEMYKSKMTPRSPALHELLPV